MLSFLRTPEATPIYEFVTSKMITFVIKSADAGKRIVAGGR
jgi:hypothetical protein